jgi:hypothetical protein
VGYALQHHSPRSSLRNIRPADQLKRARDFVDTIARASAARSRPVVLHASTHSDLEHMRTVFRLYRRAVFAAEDYTIADVIWLTSAIHLNS